MENKKNVSKVVIFSVIGIVILILCIIAISFSVFYNAPMKVKKENFDGGDISLTYADEVNSFSITNGVPTSDLVGVKLDSADKYFDFTVNTKFDEANEISYEIIIIKDEKKSTTLDNNIKLYLEKQENGVYTDVFGPSVFDDNVVDDDFGKYAMSVYEEKTTTNRTDNYRLRMWISDKAVFSPEEIQNYTVKIAIKGEAR